MELADALLLLITGTTSALLAAVSVAAYLRRASPSTRRAKLPPSLPATESFESRFAQIEADQAELFSTLQKLTTSMKRLSSRAGMQDLRERRGNEPPPVGTPKTELRKFYGVAGMNGPEQARRQLSLVREEPPNA